jgi:predicted DNA-binding protein (UPF0251 family)
VAKPIEPLESRMERLVDRSGDCWPWLGSCDAHGYGQMGYGQRKKLKAHRVAWELANGAIPEGMSVLHRCDNPPCCNPAHLFIGTQADNMADAHAKGRQFIPQGPALRGEANPAAKLTDYQREAICVLGDQGISQRVIAAYYGISQSTVCRVLSDTESSNGKAA